MPQPRRRSRPKPVAIATHSSADTYPHTYTGLCRLLRHAKHVVVVVGAGVSVSCGIPDFRSENGLYNMVDGLDLGGTPLDQPESLFDSEFFKHDPIPFFKWAATMHRSIDKATPSATHHFMKWLQDSGRLQRVYTQNVDGLEERAGVSAAKIIYSHGHMQTYRCTKCKRRCRYNDDGLRLRLAEGQVLRCRRAKRKRKPRQTNVSESQSQLATESGNRLDPENRTAKRVKNGPFLNTGAASTPTATAISTQTAGTVDEGLHRGSDPNPTTLHERSHDSACGVHVVGGGSESLGRCVGSSDGKVEVCDLQATTHRRTHTRTHTRTHALTHAHTRTRTHTQAHTRTHAPSEDHTRTRHSSAEVPLAAALSTCDGVLRPDIIFFGEPVGQAHVRGLKIDSEVADCVLVVGTSFKTAPMSQMPFAFRRTTPLVWVNKLRYTDIHTGPVQIAPVPVCDTGPGQKGRPDWHGTIDFVLELLGDCDTVVRALRQTIECAKCSQPARKRHRARKTITGSSANDGEMLIHAPTAKDNVLVITAMGDRLKDEKEATLPFKAADGLSCCVCGGEAGINREIAIVAYQGGHAVQL